MKRLWKDFRVNMMYWRFRYITRNRLRLRSWWTRRRQTSRVPRAYRPSSYRERGTATYVQPHSARRSWAALLVMVGLLTALTVYVDRVFVNPGLVYVIGALIVCGTIYWSLRGVQ